MSTLAILPASNIASSLDLGSTNPTGLQQTAFNNLLSRLQQAISAGNLTSSRSLLNALDALPPTGVSEMAALSKFLTGVGAALAGGSMSEAQVALSEYQVSSKQASGAPATTQNSTQATAQRNAGSLVQSQIQLNLVSSLLLHRGSDESATASSTHSVMSLVDFLNTAYGNQDAASAPSSSSMNPSPYDTLVAALKANLAAGVNTAGPALAYLQSKGSLISVEA